jgi:hypothetical protein
MYIIYLWLIAVDMKFKKRSDFDHPNTGIVELNPTRICFLYALLSVSIQTSRWADTSSKESYQMSKTFIFSKVNCELKHYRAIPQK